MKSKVLSIIVVVIFFLLSPLFGNAQKVEVIKYPDLEKIISEKSEKVKVINFWATWCGPCIKELPYFEKAHQQYKDQNLQVYLISFDDVENLQKKVTPFIERKKIQATVKLLDETDYNSFIDKVDPSWSGAIPATLIIAGDKREFIEGELKEEELNQLIKKYLSK